MEPLVIRTSLVTREKLLAVSAAWGLPTHDLKGRLQSRSLAENLTPWRAVVRVKSLLRSVLVNLRTKIALLVEEPHSNDGHAEVAGSFELITGHITEPT